MTRAKELKASGVADNLDVELAALVDLDGRQQAVAEVCQRWSARLGRLLRAELLAVGAELAELGACPDECLTVTVARCLRECADELERG